MGLISVKRFKCPICGKEYVSLVAVWTHMEQTHPMPNGIPADQYYYDLTHNGKKSYCTECHKPTAWNPRTHKYRRLCGNPECLKKVRETFKNRMKSVGKDPNQAQFADHQRKMLAARRISGVYEWEDGGKTTYTGTYEKDFLAICEHLLNLKSSDIIGPSPNAYKYAYKDQIHFYIPDFYIPDLNIEIEIKDGGDNPNMHHKIQEVDKVKEQMKDKVMMKQKGLHYIKIKNKQYGQFMEAFTKIKDGGLDRINERDGVKIV